MAKFVSVTATTTGPDGEDHVYAVDEYGTVWRITVKGAVPASGWTRLPDAGPPKPSAVPGRG